MLALQLALTYWLPLASLFGTAPIGVRAWGEISVVGLTVIIIIELEKRWLTKKSPPTLKVGDGDTACSETLATISGSHPIVDP